MMFDRIINIMESVFSSYFVGLALFCSLFLSYIYPRILIYTDIEFKKEYNLGRYVGYIYAIGSILGFFIVKLFG
jgi:hypothetical protein